MNLKSEALKRYVEAVVCRGSVVAEDATWESFEDERELTDDERWEIDEAINVAKRWLEDIMDEAANFYD